ncbi:MAG: xanthine phosphoribosyltransferase [Erysipelotrichaceae bacterium]|nr:xanthine phosphoribosyltransferase [Erysipelotrichaceae bacterium]
MKLLEERIAKDGRVIGTEILKVDSFLNHQIDVNLLDEIGKELFRLFKDRHITKVITIEASGIAIAVSAARYFNVPCVFAKKARSLNIGKDVYRSKVHSFTYDNDYDITMSQSYLNSDDTVLIVDDFLANGAALKGMISICEQASASIGGIGICIEKGFQPGGDEIRSKGYPLESLAIIESMSEEGIVFRNA